MPLLKGAIGTSYRRCDELFCAKAVFRRVFFRPSDTMAACRPTQCRWRRYLLGAECRTSTHTHSTLWRGWDLALASEAADKVCCRTTLLSISSTNSTTQRVVYRRSTKPTLAADTDKCQHRRCSHMPKQVNKLAKSVRHHHSTHSIVSSSTKNNPCKKIIYTKCERSGYYLYVVVPRLMPYCRKFSCESVDHIVTFVDVIRSSCRSSEHQAVND